MGTMHRMSGRSRLWTCNQGLWRDNKDMAGCGDRSLNLKLRVSVDTQSYWMRSIALPCIVSHKSSGRHVKKKNSTFGSEPPHRKPCMWNPESTDVIGGGVGSCLRPGTWSRKWANDSHQEENTTEQPCSYMHRPYKRQLGTTVGQGWSAMFPST